MTQPEGRWVRPEIWGRVLWFLHREVPGVMSKPDRRDVMQGDLVSAMRVCSTLYDLAIPLLYTTVVCDDLAGLLYAHPRSRCTGRVAGKASHLSRIKHLYLENTHHPWDPHAAFTFQLSSLHRALHSPVFTVSCGPFLNLETLALGSIFGQADMACWDAFCRCNDPVRGRMIREVSDAMPRLLLSPRLQHICQRGGGALLNFPALIEEPPSSLSSAIFTTHILPGEEYWTLPLGRPCRWILDSPHSYPFSAIRPTVESALITASSLRPWTPEEVDQRIMLDIYASGVEVAEAFNRKVDDTLPPGWRWEGMTAAYWDCVEPRDFREVVREMVEKMGGFGTGKDVVRWLPQVKAGRCCACGQE